MILGLLTQDCATLHYEADMLDDSNVFERIAGNGNDVGEVSGLEFADLALPPE